MKDIKYYPTLENLPLKVEALDKCQSLFSLPPFIYTYYSDLGIYALKEKSGLIRAGFTPEFLIKYPKYFKYELD